MEENAVEYRPAAVYPGEIRSMSADACHDGILYIPDSSPVFYNRRDRGSFLRCRALNQTNHLISYDNGVDFLLPEYTKAAG